MRLVDQHLDVVAIWEFESLSIGNRALMHAILRSSYQIFFFVDSLHAKKFLQSKVKEMCMDLVLVLLEP